MISCEQHDYVEIVCIFQFPVRLTLKNDHIIEGVASNIKVNSEKQEYLEVNKNGTSVLVLLDELSQMDVCVDNPHFRSVSFR
jgi:Rho-binding antiterminator